MDREKTDSLNNSYTYLPYTGRIWFVVNAPVFKIIIYYVMKILLLCLAFDECHLIDHKYFLFLDGRTGRAISCSVPTIGNIDTHQICYERELRRV